MLFFLVYLFSVPKHMWQVTVASNCNFTRLAWNCSKSNQCRRMVLKEKGAPSDAINTTNGTIICTRKVDFSVSQHSTNYTTVAILRSLSISV